MSDLTERLRNRSLALKSVSRQTVTTKYDAELSDEAADEIDRLTAALAEASARLERYRLANTEENDLNILAHEIDAAARALKEKP